MRGASVASKVAGVVIPAGGLFARPAMAAEMLNQASASFSPTTAVAVPEPEVWALIALAAVAIVVRQVRRLRRPAARIH